MYDASFGDLQESNKVTLEPSYDIKINLVPYMTDLGKLVDRINSLPGSGLGIGAVVKIFFPVDLEVKNLWFNGNSHTVALPKDNDGKDKEGEGAVATYGGPAPEWSGNKIQIKMTHRPGIDIGVGPYADFSLFYVFSIGFEKIWKLSELTEIPIRFGTFENYYATTVGTRSQASIEAAPEVLAEVPTIVFDEPVLA